VGVRIRYSLSDSEVTIVCKNSSNKSNIWCMLQSSVKRTAVDSLSRPLRNLLISNTPGGLLEMEAYKRGVLNKFLENFK